MNDELNKDEQVLSVLKQLRDRLGADAFILSDHWESDLCAVGIASPLNSGVLVYISTYRLSPGRFSYELELPSAPDEDVIYHVAGTGENVSFEELAAVVKQHLSRAHEL